jgi:Uma2 family endonuclease
MKAREPSVAYTTAEELFARSPGRCELIDGEVVAMTPSGGRHGRYTAELAMHLALYVRQHRIGRVYGAETGFILARDPDVVRAPDVAFVARERVIDTERFLEQAPDLAVEVLSPSDAYSYVDTKIHQWLDAGTRTVWIIDPQAGRVQIYRRGERNVLDLGLEDAIDGADVLPDFRLDLRELFADDC